MSTFSEESEDEMLDWNLKTIEIININDIPGEKANL
jgi:hypothetical protein